MNNKSYPDIFFGLKGGLNNFGIVTNFKMRVVPQTLVYGGVLLYINTQFDAIVQVMVDFHARNKDPRAQTGGYFSLANGRFILTLVIFYDAPTPPEGIFDGFLSIPHLGSLQTLSYLSLIQAPAVARLATVR